MEQKPQGLYRSLKGLTGAEFAELMERELIKRGLAHLIPKDKQQHQEVPKTLTIIFQPLPPRKKEQP
jgi:hypothetical protein